MYGTHQNASLFRINKYMPNGYEKLFSQLESPEPALGLFDRIILAIKKEQELRHAKNIFLGFLALAVVSISAIPLSLTMLINQTKNSGIFYFIVSALADLKTFIAAWQSFGLAILESLPIMETAFFIASAGLALFTVRLFLREKRLFFGYLRQNLA